MLSLLLSLPLGKILLTVFILEATRRIVQSFALAYTGPLAKIPGPWWLKFSDWPSIYLNLRGVQWKKAHWRSDGWFEIYASGKGDSKGRRGVVRVAPQELAVADIEGVQKILVRDDMIKSDLYEMSQISTPIGRVSAIMNERDRIKYKRRRRLLSAGFAISYLNGLEYLMKDCMRVFEEVVDGKCSEAISKDDDRIIVDVQLLFSNLTTDIISATSFGGSFNLVKTNSKDIRRLMSQKLFRVVIYETIPFAKYIPFVPPVRVVELEQMLDGIVKTRRQENEQCHLMGMERKKDLLQIIIEASESDPEHYTDYHIREDLVTFMIAGSDTSAFSLTVTLLLLLNNPSTLRKLEAEVFSTFPEGTEHITFAETQDMVYLNAVLKESGRRMPVVQGGLPRETEEDTIISGYEIPKGTIVYALVGALLKDPTIWPDPHLFVPERWLSPYKGAEVNKAAYYPFSYGRHSCPGQQFALREMRLILATVIRRYEISLVEGQSHEVRFGTTAYMEQGFYNVGFRRRKGM